MELNIKFTVHNVAPSEDKKVVSIAGEDTAVIIPVTEVELVPSDGSHSALTLRFRSSAAEAARQAFVIGEEVTWSVQVPTPVAKAAA